MSLSIIAIKLSAACAVCAVAAGIYDSGLRNIEARESRISEVEASISGFNIYQVKLGHNSHGVAIIQNGDFLIRAEFEFEVVDDSNGALGHSAETIAIDAFKITSVINTKTNKSHSDYTGRDDHLQMIAQVRAHVDQKRLVEGV